MAASHQLSLTSLASNYNIVAAGDKSDKYKQITVPQKQGALRRQTRVCASRTVSLKEAAPTSTSTRRKRSSQEKVEPPKKRSRKPATVQISDGGEAAGNEARILRKG